MAAVSLVSMRARVVDRADALGYLSLSDATDKAYIDAILNSALARLHDTLTQAFEDYQLTISGAIVVSSPASTFTLSSASITNLLKLRSLERLLSSGRYEDVPSISVTERNRAQKLGYFLVGSTVHLFPASQAPNSYRLWYTPTFTALVNDGDTYEAINGWEELAVVDAARQVKDEAEKDVTILDKRYTELYRLIQEAARQRNAGGPKKVRKVRRTLVDRVLAFEENE
jgi:hypothetical protein